MSLVEECAVCAGPLEWTAFGPCGHKEACSHCVARLRFVMSDKRCVICQQESPQVFVTRHMGDYTQRVPAEAFAALQARAAAGELATVPAINGYFDDAGHAADVRQLCSFTHSILDKPGAPGQVFGSVDALRQHIDKAHSQLFCDLCLASRKVFTCEQLLYSKNQLERHMRAGDLTGPLAESGFTGHPLCKFCRKRFYDSNELYKHMEGRHEHCFLCRRATPDKYVYYRDYAELEGHFSKEHHPCGHAACLERKFVVFGSEAELKRHTAQEHGDELRLSRAQRREALTLPLQFQYRRREEEAAPPVDMAHVRPGVVIGGGHNVSGRHGGRQQGGMRHARSEPQLAHAVAASLESAQSEAVARSSAAAAAAAAAGGYRSETDQAGGDDTGGSVTFTAEDFPAVSGGRGLGTVAGGRWAAAAAPSRRAGGAAGTTEDDFPALPTMSKSAKKRAKEKEKQGNTLHARLVAAAQPIRVLRPGSSSSSSHAAGASLYGGAGASTSQGAAAGSGSYGGTTGASSSCDSFGAAGGPSQPAGDGFTAVAGRHFRGASGSAAAAAAGNAGALSASDRPGNAFAALGASEALGGPSFSDAQAAAAAAAAAVDDFPALAPAGGAASAGGAGRSMVDRLKARTTHGSLGSYGPSGSAGGAGGFEEAFPSLPAAAPAPKPHKKPLIKKKAAAAAAAPPPIAASATEGGAPMAQLLRAGSGSGLSRAASGSAAGSSSNLAVLLGFEYGGQQPPSADDFPTLRPSGSRGSLAAAAPAPASPGPGETGVSSQLKAANKALVAKIKSQLDEAHFASFKAQSAAFVAGRVSAADYHGTIVGLGLLLLAPEMAALCPEEDRRAQLLAAHRQHLASAAALTPGRAGWMPPEAAAAAAATADAASSWSCTRCTLLNAPSCSRCEACLAPRLPQRAAFEPAGFTPSASAGRGSPAASSRPSTASSPAMSRAGSSSVGAAGAAAAAATAAGGGMQRSGSSGAFRAAAPPPSEDAFPSLPARPTTAPSGSAAAGAAGAPSSSSSQQQQGGGGGKKGKAKQSLQDFLTAGKTHPQNVWTQGRAGAEGAPEAAPARGQWAKGGGGKLAKSIGAINDAWEKR